MPYSRIGAERKAYGEDQRRLTTQFKTDLFEEFGVTDNPKREDCFELAWERGHAEGLNCVLMEFEALVGLIK